MKKALILFILLGFLVIPSFCSDSDILERAVTLYKWKYYDDSIVELDKLVQGGKEPFISRANFLKAYCLLKKGYTLDAKELFQSLAANTGFPLHDYAKFKLADIYLSNQDHIKAYKEYDEFFADSALKPDSEIKKAECLYLSGNIKGAIGLYRSIISEGSSQASLDKARFNLGKCYEKLGDPKAAIKAYHEVNLYHPLSPLVKESLARINFISKRYNIYPGAANAEDLFNKALIFYNFGDYGSAGMFFQQIVNNYRSSNLWEDALFKAAMCDYSRKRLKSSILKFKRCISYGGDYAAAAQFYIAFAYGKSGYFYQTLESLNKVLINHPDSMFADDAAYWLGYYYETNGYKDTALGCYEKFIAQHPKSDLLTDGYWKIGRVYYFKKDYMKAYETFKTALSICKKGNMLDACAYWKGLCQEKLGDRGGAEDSYRFVVSRFDHTFYSYRAREKLISFGKEIKDGPEEEADLPYFLGNSQDDLALSEEPLPFEPGIEGTKNMDEVQKIKVSNIKDHFIKYSELMAVGFYEEAALEATVLVDNSPQDKKMSARLALATANYAAGKVRDSIIFAESLCNNAIFQGTFRDLPKQTWNLAYPKGYFESVRKYAKEFGLEEALIFAVIREESRFNPKTVSWANARGLMQIIPQTGRNVARLIGIRPYYTMKLHEPETNIRMGSYYLSQLVKRFEGNIVYALAAYNGGPLRVKKWKNKWQAEIGAEIDMDEFIESIPLSETRRYVQKVLKSYYEYKRLYKG